MRSRAFLVGTLLLLVGVAVPVGAETSVEVRELARRAHTDGAALNRLRSVKEVDGRPVDYERALAGADDAALEQRLDAIEAGFSGDLSSSNSSSGGGAPVPATARQEAERILASRAFRPAQPPRPLLGAIRKLGDWLEPVAGPIGRFLAPLGRWLVRVAETPWKLGLLGLAVMALAALISVRLGRRRSGMAVAGPHAGLAVGGRPRTARQLEHEADAREAAGDLGEAYRLRFLAGVLRLDEAGVLPYRTSLTTGQLVRAVRSPALGPLAATFDEVAYGGRQPEPRDLTAAKTQWPRVLEEARR